jgi:hypothetical protein
VSKSDDDLASPHQYQTVGGVRNPDPPPVEDEARTVTPFVTFDRGFATVDPSDENRVVFEDFSPRVLKSDAPDEVYEAPEIPTVPKDSSAPEPASSSESPSTSEPVKSENPAPPAPSDPTGVPVTEPAVGTVAAPTMPALGPLPFPTGTSTEDAATDDGSPNPSESS